MPAKQTSGKAEGIREGLKKATTEMLVLFMLRRKPMYTYEMMSTIEELSEGKIVFNTLYQAIYRLQKFGYIRESGKVVSEENRVRIYFAITESGQKYLDELIEQYRAAVSTIDRILASDSKSAKESRDVQTA